MIVFAGRRRFAAPSIVLAAALLLGLTGCSSDDDSSSSTSSAPTTTSSTTAAPPSTTTATSPTTAAPPTTAAALPSDPAAYAAAAFDAWRSGDAGRLAQLTADPARAVLDGRAPQANDGWGAQICEGAAGSTYCTWKGATDQLQLRVGNEMVAQGQTQAVIEAKFCPVQPGDACP